MLIRKTILFCFTVLLTSCSDYQDSPSSEAKLVELNRIVDSARTQNASWTSSPERIARTLFPQVSSEGNRKYSISSKDADAASQEITVLEEGAIDDEVLGKRHVITFKQERSQWKIVDYKYAAKRRD